MGVELKFDTSNNIEMPTMVLTYKSGERISNISGIDELQFVESMQNPNEFSFKVYKKTCNVWDELKTFRHIWVREWNDWYSIEVEENYGESSVKNVTAKHLPEYELSNARITTEINTESDSTLVDNKSESIIYDSENPKKSILNRILEPMRAFEIGYVSPSLKDLVMNFSFSDSWIYDALAEVAEQLEAHFEFLAYTDEQTGEIHRVVNLYDLNPYCSICHTRLSNTDKQCTNKKCKSTNIRDGYGEDTSVFFSLDNVLDSITYSTNTDEVKNCFKLEADDDIMTGYILSCNPNGSQYIWYMDTFLDEMSDELRQAYEKYIETYNEYNNDKLYVLEVSEYNNLVQKYRNMYNDESKIPDLLELLDGSYKGYSSLVNVLYSTEGVSTYLETTLMPTTSVGLKATDANEQAENLLDSITSVAITGDFSSTVAKNAVLDMAKAIIDSRYSVKITNYEAKKQSSPSNQYQVGILTGTFYVENYSDEEDCAEITTSTPIIIIDNFEEYLADKLNKTLDKGENKNYDTVSLFDLEKDIETFKKELKYYGLSSLERFKKCCDENISILVDEKIAEETHNLYNAIYLPYNERSKALSAEILQRESEINIISNFKEQVQEVISDIQKKLNLQKYLEESGCWIEFCSLRREDIYSNSNYTSDGLTKLEILKNASTFMETAKKELVKSATLQHSISVSLKNIFAITEFRPLLENFKIGNWIRVEIDNEVYKLRLIEYSFDYSDFKNMDVEFSDVTQVENDINDVEDLISQMRSISGNYSYVERQAEQGRSSYETICKWFDTGMDATMTKIVNSADNVSMIFDSAGLLGRRYKDFSDNEFEDEQMRLINNSLVFTRNNWQSICTAVGKFYYISGTDEKGNPILTSAYGINGEVIAGKLFIGQNLRMYNTSGSLTFDEKGFVVRTYDSNTGTLGAERMRIDPNGDITFNPKNFIIDTTNDGGYIDIKSKNFTVTKDGTVNITGKITAISGSIGGWEVNSDSLFSTVTSNKSGMCSNSSKYAFWAGENNGAFGAANTDAKFKVGHNGSLVATSANISGNITATNLTATNKGNIACWTINSDAIYRSSSSFGGYGGMYFGTSGLSISSNFTVNSSGVLTAKGVNIVGDIDASSIKANSEYKLYLDNSVKSQTIIKANQYNSDEYLEFSIGYVGESGFITFSKGNYNSGSISITGNTAFQGSTVWLNNDAKILSSTFEGMANDYVDWDLAYTLHQEGVGGWRNTENGNLIPVDCQNSSDGGTHNIGNSTAYIKTLFYATLDKKSDRRLKHHIGELDDSYLVMLKEIPAVRYSLKSDKDLAENWGFYAQDFRDCFIRNNLPISKILGISLIDSDGEYTYDLYADESKVRYGLSYEQGVPILWKGWQHHQSQIESLKQENQSLKEKIDKLEKLVNQLIDG